MREKLTLCVLAAMIMVAFFTPDQTSAQTAFYVEEMKDGRIYVFNDPKAYQLYQESGELEVRITRIGAGPNGETIYFDSENAIHLYNFKHNLPAEVIIKAEEKKPTVKVSWKDGKTTITTDNAELKISNRIQFRYTDSEALPSILPPGITGDRIGAFRIRRAKTKFEGWFYNTNITYELQLNWVDVTNALEDANINFDFTNGKKMFMIKGGQFKVPFGRQELTSSGNQEFVDRSAASNLFSRGRDIGVQAWGLALNNKLDWRVGFFNGNGRNVIINDNADFQIDARVTFQPWGDVKYSEGDFESTDRPLFAVGVGVETTQQSGVPSTSVPAGFNRELDTVGFDAVFKYKGVFVFFEDFQRNQEDLLTNTTVDLNGYNFQAGYFIVPKKFEVAGRYAAIDPNEDVDGDLQKEYGVAFGYFYNKHNFKLQGDYRRLESETRNAKFDEFRVQLQFIF